MRTSEAESDYAIQVRPQPRGCAWIVTQADGVAMSGEADDAESAHRCGVFAAAALQALQKIGRRRF